MPDVPMTDEELLALRDEVAVLAAGTSQNATAVTANLTSARSAAATAVAARDLAQGYAGEVATSETTASDAAAAAEAARDDVLELLTGLVWRDAWAADVAYVIADAVTHVGSAWRAVAASTAVTPGSDDTKWRIIAGVAVEDRTLFQDAVDAAAAAAASAAAAALSETAAETAETNAETAETNAETAQGLAEAARADAIAIADGVIAEPRLESVTETDPPGSPALGDRYFVPAGATGAWVGHEGEIARRLSASWSFVTPGVGLAAYIVDEDRLAVWTGTAWTSDHVVSTHGATAGLTMLEVETTGLAGAYVATALVIPAGSLVVGVAPRTTTAITGAPSFQAGIDGDPDLFASGLGVTLGATAVVPCAVPVLVDTPLRLTAVGGDFTGGAARVAVSLLRFGAPSS